MKVPGAVARRGTKTPRARGSRPGVRSYAAASAAVLLLLLVLSGSTAGASNLVPNGTDLPDAGITTPVPIPETDLKIIAPPDDVVIEVPTPEPSPEGGSAGPGPVTDPVPPPEPEPDSDGGAEPPEANDPPAREQEPAPEDQAATGPEPEATPATHGDARTAGEVPVGLLRTRAIRGVAPGLAVLATRAKELATPLAAPMGLGLVAMVLLGLASRGPGVISKLNEELESADGRQVWRF